MNPFSIRQIRAREIFTFMERFGSYIEWSHEESEDGKVVEMNGKKVIRRKAGDDWF